MPTVPAPEKIDLIGDTVAIRWADGQEDFFPMEQLRALSPSAENTGEPDIFGNIHGGDERTSFPGVTVVDWEIVGRYAIRFIFSDGHNTGLYTFKYLRDEGRRTKDEGRKTKDEGRRTKD
ncbi:MAG: gamma-butyrobetaine hydroxylase-like domain-containing protein [Oceanipulchritudo sp.]